ncbi:hypothetical protein Y032_0221g2583 [Ancylostoma ceylanicum]|uniref:Uncharacterized protein n=1 Tax=Ancylostoma ceylanicum TaxID=53326 RepID=A0A016SJ94_9BILA|nr:hypothetical protein Y032_0221g2583 [Ancylostoma ceylanicum]
MKNNSRAPQFKFVAALLLRFHIFRWHPMGTLKMQTCATLHHNIDLRLEHLEELKDEFDDGGCGASLVS